MHTGQLTLFCLSEPQFPVCYAVSRDDDNYLVGFLFFQTLKEIMDVAHLEHGLQCRGCMISGCGYIIIIIIIITS